MAKVIQVIQTIETRGTGADESHPMRGVTQYWTLEGELLAEVDPCPPPSETDDLRAAISRALYWLLGEHCQTHWAHNDAYQEDVRSIKATVK